MPNRLLRLCSLLARTTALCSGLVVVFTLSALILGPKGWLETRAFTLLHVQRVPGAPRAQLALVRSRPVLHSALSDPNVARLPGVAAAADPVEWLERHLSADFVAPEVLRLSVRSADAKEALVLVTAVRDAFLREIVNRKNGRLNAPPRVNVLQEAVIAR